MSKYLLSGSAGRGALKPSGIGTVLTVGNRAGVRRDVVALEARRLCAADMLERGISAAEVARQVGVHRQSVNRWAQQIAMGGRASLKHAGYFGRPPRLSAADRRRIERDLKRGPEALGYATGFWTAWRVADLIKRECGIKYHPGHVWRLLKQLGWSCSARRAKPWSATMRRSSPGNGSAAVNGLVIVANPSTRERKIRSALPTLAADFDQA